MMKPYLKFISICLSLILLCTFTCGCKSNNSNAVIYFEAPDVPNTLDPQLASSDTELLLVRNLFEGLLRVDENGEIVNGIIDGYTFKNNVYTFEISEKATWSDGTSVTADDFVFAFRRAVDPETKSPYGSKLSSIMNAPLILSGDISPINLGVNAVDSKTLTITVEETDDEFLYKLTTAVCMPCREDFFNGCKGQYGLSKSHILTNGSYKLSKWNRDDLAIRLHRNEKYYGNFAPKNSAVFISYNPEVDNIEKLSKSSVDIAFINMSQLNESDSLELKNAQYQNVVWVMEISNAFSYELRQSLLFSFNRSSYSEDLADGYSVAYSLFPFSLTGENLDYVGMPVYDIKQAKALFGDEVKKFENKKLPPTTLVYFENDEMQLPINDIVGHWQNNIGAYINVMPVSTVNEAKNAAKNGSYSIAVYPVKITDKDPSVFCNQLGYNYSQASVRTLNAAQTNIMSQYTIMPIAFENSVISYSNDIIDFNFGLGNGLIDFAYVTKK